MSQLKVRVALSILVLMMATISVQAQERRSPQHSRQGQEQTNRGERGHGRQGLPPIPNLTEEQKEQMKAIHLETEKATLPIRNQIGEKEARLRTLVTADTYDEKATNKVLEEMGALRTEIQKLRITSLQKAKEVLTEEQVLFLYNHMEKDGKRGHGPRHRAGRGHGPLGGR